MMALFGRETVVVPLGISCQTAHQVERAAPLLAELTAEIFQQHTTPFDTRIVGAGDMARMIAADEFFPQTADELTGTKRPYWKKHSCHFWHDGIGNFWAFKEKQAHLRASWRRIGGYKRKVFILSNTQNNLAQKEIDPGGFRRNVDMGDLVTLAVTLSREFDKPELHVVSRRPLFERLDMMGELAKELHGAKLSIHFVEPDSTQWHGDDEIWDGTLARIMGDKREARS